jgi:hypothetical protein
MDNGFFETMTNEIFNDNNPNVEKQKWYYKDQPSHGSHSNSSKSL